MRCEDGHNCYCTNMKFILELRLHGMVVMNMIEYVIAHLIHICTFYLNVIYSVYAFLHKSTHT